MQPKNLLQASLLAGSFGLIGCSAEFEPLVEFRTAQANGFALNGFGFNGFALNGFAINGPGAVAWSFEGKSVYLDYNKSNGKFKLVPVGGGKKEKFKPGDTLTAEVTVGGSQYQLRFSNYEDGPGPYHYQTVETAAWNGNGWDAFNPACGNGLSDRGLVVWGYWDQNAEWVDDDSIVSFACETSDAVGKAIALGLHPDEKVGSASLREYHQAATRAIRADYCYSNTPYTVNGTLIDIYDTLGVLSQASSDPIEAVWGESGALCVGDPRISTYTHGDLGCSLTHCNTQTDAYWESHPDALVITRVAAGN